MGVDTFCSRGPSILIFKECAYIFRNKIIGGDTFPVNGTCIIQNLSNHNLLITFLDCDILNLKQKFY